MYHSITTIRPDNLQNVRVFNMQPQRVYKLLCILFIKVSFNANNISMFKFLLHFFVIKRNFARRRVDEDSSCYADLSRSVCNAVS